MLAGALAAWYTSGVRDFRMIPRGKNVWRFSMKNILFSLLIILVTSLCAYAAGNNDSAAPLMIATTTSLQDTGFMDKMVARFTKATGIQTRVIPAGTGEALKMGERGDVDVVIVHSRKDEEKFMKKGYGVSRKELMYNHFLIAGPKDDPAGIKAASTPEAAFKKICDRKCTFVSRADNSGTHKKEREIWKNAGITQKGSWYIESGAGMAQALRLAHEKNGYIFTDESTFNVLRGTLGIVPFPMKSPSLKNTYSVILVNPEKLPKVNYMKAQQFQAFLFRKESRDFIKNFRDKNGNRLYIPVSVDRPKPVKIPA